MTLRQRMDACAVDLFDFLPALIETLLSSARPDYGVLPCGLRFPAFETVNGAFAALEKG